MGCDEEPALPDPVLQFEGAVAFAANESNYFAVDAQGTLWRIDPHSGVSTAIDSAPRRGDGVYSILASADNVVWGELPGFVGGSFLRAVGTDGSNKRDITIAGYCCIIPMYIHDNTGSVESLAFRVREDDHWIFAVASLEDLETVILQEVDAGEILSGVVLAKMYWFIGSDPSGSWLASTPVINGSTYLVALPALHNPSGLATYHDEVVLADNARSFEPLSSSVYHVRTDGTVSLFATLESRVQAVTAVEDAVWLLSREQGRARIVRITADRQQQIYDLEHDVIDIIGHGDRLLLLAARNSLEFDVFALPLTR